ncbi:MAG: chemotaxis protein CheA, partial [Guyparkeria sp.]
MAFEPDNELLQDFLIEAGELLNGLDQQLIELEQSPDDADRLNSVFRAFHTIKGGAGFLEVHPLVEVCHRAEDIFNLLRNHEITMNGRIMDVMLQVIDVLNGMFDSLRAGEYPEDVSKAFLKEIEGLAHQDAAPAAPTRTAPEAPPAEPVQVADSVAEEDDAFDRMLADLDAAESDASPAASDAADADLISDEEFESLLDELHGKGKFQAPTPETAATGARKESAAADSDEITDEEFEAVLDELYGKGKAPTAAAPKAAKPVETTAPAPEKPAAPSPAAGKAAEPAKAETKPKADTHKAPVETTVRVDTERLDSIMNLVGELVLVRNRMNTLKSTFENEEIASVIATLDMVTSDLQGAVMKTRMQPVKKVFGRFPRVVRDTARTLGKEVNLELEGEDTDLDKNLVEALADPLIHLVRN